MGRGERRAPLKTPAWEAKQLLSIVRCQGGTFGNQIKQFTTRNRSALIDQDYSSKTLLWSK